MDLDWERSHWAAQDIDLGVDEGTRAEYGLGALTRRLKLIGISL